MRCAAPQITDGGTYAGWPSDVSTACHVFGVPRRHLDRHLLDSRSFDSIHGCKKLEQGTCLSRPNPCPQKNGWVFLLRTTVYGKYEHVFLSTERGSFCGQSVGESNEQSRGSGVTLRSLFLPFLCGFTNPASPMKHFGRPLFVMVYSLASCQALLDTFAEPSSEETPESAMTPQTTHKRKQLPNSAKAERQYRE